MVGLIRAGLEALATHLMSTSVIVLLTYQVPGRGGRVVGGLRPGLDPQPLLTGDGQGLGLDVAAWVGLRHGQRLAGRRHLQPEEEKGRRMVNITM